MISGKVKGGFTVDINEIRAFLPGSLVDIRPLRETAHLEGKPLEFKVIKLDQKRNNVVVSRRAVLEEENSAEREALLESLQEGQVVKGIVKNLTDYGAFVDLGGVDGLLHITDMAWRRIRHPSEMVNVGDEVEVKILKFDRERNRVSLGMKQLGDDPWVDITRRYPEGARVLATVTNLTDYGCFAEIEEGVEGLVHVSEMDWTNKNIHPSKVVPWATRWKSWCWTSTRSAAGSRSASSSAGQNPWEEFGIHHAKGDRYQRQDQVDHRLRHLHRSGRRHRRPGAPLRHLLERARRECGAPLLQGRGARDRHPVGGPGARAHLPRHQAARSGRVLRLHGCERPRLHRQGHRQEVEPKEAVIELAQDVLGTLKASEISVDRVEDARNVLKPGDEVEVKIISIDRKNRNIGLSIKAKDIEDERSAVRDHRSRESGASERHHAGRSDQGADGSGQRRLMSG
jgi:small subunit ribosomal protein S1